MPKVVVVGSINTDLVVRLNAFPMPGETIVGKSFRTFGGGKGANQATSAARLGADVLMIGAVGDDAFSGERLSSMTAAGVDCGSVLTRENTQGGIAVIQVDSAGQNSIVMVPGANETITSSDIRQLLPELLSPGDLLIGPLELRLDTMIEAVRIANESEARTMINIAPVVSGADELVSMLDTLIVNEIEAGQLLGRGAVEPGEAPQVAEELAALGPQTILITLGSHGAFIRTSEVTALIPVPPVDVVDTTGAGDAAVGAFAAAICQGLSPREAGIQSVFAGSYAVQYEGAQSSQANQQQLERFIAASSLSR